MSFKSEWKGYFPVKTIKNEKFYCLPCGKNLFCLYQGRNVIQEHQSQMFLLRGLQASMFVDAQLQPHEI